LFPNLIRPNLFFKLCPAIWGVKTVCERNSLTSLNVTNNPELHSIICGNSPLTSLDLSKNPKLTHLGLVLNPLPRLDLSKNSALVGLYCDKVPLTSLDISNNSAIKILTLKSMTSLNKVCVWTMPFPPVGVTVDTTDSPNVYFTIDCSK
jgi:hypothetical protein